MAAILTPAGDTARNLLHRRLLRPQLQQQLRQLRPLPPLLRRQRPGLHRHPDLHPSRGLGLAQHRVRNLPHEKQTH
jgi:hypothetical protein